MKRHPSLYIGLLLLGASSAQSLAAPNDPTTGAKSPHNGILPSHPAKVQAAMQFSHLPLSFEPNQGQADRSVRFLTHSLDAALSLNASEAVFTLPAQPGVHQKNRKTLQAAGKSSVTTLHMQLVGADPHASTLQQQTLPGRVNYFCDKDPRKWHSDIPTFGKVGFQGVYPGVDVVYYGNQRHLEYDFLVAPHADPKQIQLHFTGAQRLRVDAAGDLILHSGDREMTWRKPTVYQQDATGKHIVAARYRIKTLSNGQKGVAFALGHYDTSRPLVIDPVLLYSTRLGTGAIPQSAAIAIDSSGYAYIANYSEVNISEGVVSVNKVYPDGSNVLYSTFLGPARTPGIAVDSAGDAYVTGLAAQNFPTTPGAYKTQLLGTPTDLGDVFVSKLNPTGSGLIYSTFIGPGAGSAPVAIAIDGAGNAYLTGPALPGFPTTTGAFQTVDRSAALGVTGFVTKLNPTGTALVYSTYLGGKSDLRGIEPPAIGDSGSSIAIDSNGDAFIAGTTNSSDFPTTTGAYQTTISLFGSYTAFVTEVNPTGTALVYSTYFGGDIAQGQGIALDSSGNAYVDGAVGDPFPTTPGAFQTVGGGAFVAKFNPTGTALIYSTRLGGNSTEMANGIAVDGSGNAYVVGQTYSSNFPTTIGAFQRVKQVANYSNAFLTKLNATGTALIYSTLLGGSVINTSNVSASIGDAGQAIAIDGSGNAYITGTTLSADFPTTPNAVQGRYGNYFAAKISTAPIFPDFNNDGNTDLLLQNPTTGAIAGWFMQGAKLVGSASFSLTPPAGFALVGVGDFSANGDNTLVLQSSATHQVALWYTSGATINGGSFVDTTPDAAYKLVGVGDFNGDGKSDLVFQNQTTNQIAIWFMDGSHRYGGVLLPIAPSAGWNVVGTGDFNGDGFTDIAFQNQTTGQIALWYMNGTTYIGGTILAAVPAPGWNVVGVGDYNGNGSADLLFQNQTTGQGAVWYLINGAFASGATFSTAVPPGYKIVGPH